MLNYRETSLVLVCQKSPSDHLFELLHCGLNLFNTIDKSQPIHTYLDLPCVPIMISNFALLLICFCESYAKLSPSEFWCNFCLTITQYLDKTAAISSQLMTVPFRKKLSNFVLSFKHVQNHCDIAATNRRGYRLKSATKIAQNSHLYTGINIVSRNKTHLFPFVVS